MRTNGWTDMTKLIVAFHNFAKVPKMVGTNVLYVHEMISRR